MKDSECRCGFCGRLWDDCRKNICVMRRFALQYVASRGGVLSASEYEEIAR